MSIPATDTTILMSTENTTRGITCMTARLSDADAGASDVFCLSPVGVSGLRLVRSMFVLALGVVAGLMVMAGTAVAAPHHVYDSSLGSAGSGDGQLSGNAGVAVDQGTGDLYVADAANSRVVKYDAAGAFVSAWGWGVADGTAAAQVCTLGCQAGVPGAGAGQLASPTFVAVDNSGGTADHDVYVADTTNNTVMKFAADGTYLSTLDGSSATDGPFGGLAGVAVDTAGTVYVLDTNSALFKFAPDGSFVSDLTVAFGTAAAGVAVDSAGDIYKVRGSGNTAKLDASGASVIDNVNLCGCTTGLAVDTSTDQLYVAEGSGVTRYGADGTVQESFGAPDITISAGVAVRDANGTAYVSDVGASRVSAFAFGDPASARTDAATKVHHTSAVLNGHLDPGGDPGITDCHFDWGTTTAYGNSADCVQGDGFTASADVSGALTHLTPSQPYHYRLSVTTTSSGTITGDDQTVVPTPFPALRDEIADFGPDGTSASTFGELSRLAFDQASKKLYALDKSVPGIYGFDASAPTAYPGLAGFGPLSTVAPSTDPGLAVDNSTTSTHGDLFFVPEHGDLYGFDATGAGLGGNFPVANTTGDVCGAAVDFSGNVWLASFSAGSVSEYNSAGVLQGTIDVSAQGSPCHVAFDTAENLYVSNYNGVTYRYTAASGYANSTLIDNRGSDGVAVNPANNHLFVAHATDVSEYDATAHLVGTYSGGDTAAFSGVTVDASTNDLYLADASLDQVRVFGPGAELHVPTVATTAASGIDPHVATLNATVDPEETPVTDCHFAYVDDVHYHADAADPYAGGQTAACAPDPGSGSGDVAVSATISGLDAATTYHVTVVASSADGASTGADQTFTTPLAVRDLATQPATAITATTATLNGILDPHGAPVTNCHFSYTTDTDFQANALTHARSVPCAPDPGTGTGDVALAVPLTGLEPGTTYRFALQATSGAGTTIGATLSFTTLGPRVTNQAADLITTDSARLQATIDAQGQPTTVHFEYGTTTTYGQATPESAAIAADATNQLFTRPVDGLTPGSIYHFRAVLTNATGTSHGPDQTFTTYTTPTPTEACSNDTYRTGPSSRLPDCRAYEQASPVDKDGTNIQGTPDDHRASLAGDGITFFVTGGLPGQSGAQDYPTFLASRGTTGWTTAGLNPPARFGSSGSVLSWTPDLASTFSVAGQSEAFQVLSRDSSDGAVTSVTPIIRGGRQSVFDLAGASSDDSLVVFESRAQLTPQSIAGRTNLFSWNASTSTLSLVGVLPDSACSAPPCVPAGGSFAGPYNWFNGTDSSALASGGATESYETQAMHAVSDSGDRVFFTAGDTGQIYLRTGLRGANPTTVEVSASHAAGSDPHGTKPAIFMTASPSGAQAYFTSCQKLTSDSTAVSTSADRCDQSDQGQDLYAYNSDSNQLTDLTVDTADPHGADVKGVIGTGGPDANPYIYFAANGVLDTASHATPGDCTGIPFELHGHCNLYVYHDGTSTFIARLYTPGGHDTSDFTNWEPTVSYGNCGCFNIPTGRVSADGHTLLFGSRARLTSYDNTGPSCGDATGVSSGPCREFYRYNTESGLACVSCNPTGAPPTNLASLESESQFGVQPSPSPAPTLIRNLSADGSRVFFETADKLTSSDINGDAGCELRIAGANHTPACQDVYEWEAEGSGSCHRATTPGGCLSLISSGTSSDPAFFSDASASGDDAFFYTRDALVPQDRDQIVDVYDARTDGGLAGQHAPIAPTPCAGDACQGGSPPPPVLPAAASVNFAGLGNVSADLRLRGTGNVSVTRIRSVTGVVAALRVKVPGPGTIRVSSGLVGAATRKASRAGTYSVMVRLTSQARRSLARHRRLRLSVRVGFSPASESVAASSARVSLTFKQPARHGHGRAVTTTRRAGR